MSRKHAALVFVPLLSGAAIIGAGFSTWYFTQSSEVITNQFSAQIEAARLPGGVFTFASETTINFDQNEISYVGTTDAFVGFGYVQHAAAKEIQVEFSQDKEGNEAGVVAEWGYVNGTDYETANDIATYLQTLDLGTPNVDYYTIGDTESGSESLVYEVYYVVFTNGNNHATELLDAFKTALAAAQFQDVEGNKMTLDAAAELPESNTLTINNLPLPSYAGTFDRTDYTAYSAFREKVEKKLTLRFSTYAITTNPTETNN